MPLTFLPRVPATSRSLLALALASTLAFGAVAAAVFLGTTLGQWDLAFANWVTSDRSRLGIRAMLVISTLHNTQAVTFYAVALACVLLASRKRIWGWTVLFAVPLGMILNVEVKTLFKRPRPLLDNALEVLQTHSFPSGHTASATVLYGFIACLLLLYASPGARRQLALFACGAMVVAVGFSRLYLGAHFLSDVAAAVLAGIAWVALVAGTVRLVDGTPVRGAQTPPPTDLYLETPRHEH